MYAARHKILNMLYERKVTVDEAEELLDTVETQPRGPSIPKVELVGKSEWSQQFRKMLERVATTESPVLIQGETGTGKELVARAVHYNSRRANGPFNELSCASSPTMVDSEIFGHEEGAFTGAVRAKRGLLDAANGGTLLLDSVEVLSPETQRRLLSFLQNGSFVRLGGTRPIYADVRIVGATHQDLKSLVDQGKFRSDLYHRLSVCFLQTAPLRDRPEDILALADYLIRRQAERDGRRPLRLSAQAGDMLRAYPWPENARELMHVVEKAVVLCDGDEITPDYLPGISGQGEG